MRFYAFVLIHMTIKVSFVVHDFPTDRTCQTWVGLMFHFHMHLQTCMCFKMGITFSTRNSLHYTGVALLLVKLHFIPGVDVKKT